MHNTSYILYDIIQKEGEDKLESTPINFAPNHNLNHELEHHLLSDTEGKDIKWCEEKNSFQIVTLFEEMKILEHDISKMNNNISVN